MLELRNAALIMEATWRYDLYQFGAGYWNQLVFRFVPAQLVGMDVKTGLMVSENLGGIDRFLSSRTYSVPVGSTPTGVGDAFLQLGWFGWLFFLVLGVISRALWEAAVQSRNAIVAQLMYILTMTSAMRAVTHQTIDYFPGLLYNAIALVTLVLYAGKRNEDVDMRESVERRGRGVFQVNRGNAANDRTFKEAPRGKWPYRR